MELYWVALLASLTALATGLGALPLFFVKHWSAEKMALANCLAAGLMVAASVLLLVEGCGTGSLPQLLLVTAGTALGIVFVAASQRLLFRHNESHVDQLRAADARKAILIVFVMTVHSVTEGVGVGVSYAGEENVGHFITGAIAAHNIPEGLAIALVLAPRGVSVWKSAGWGIFSSLPQPLLALPAFMAVAAFTPLMPLGMGFAAGAMIWMTATELLPEARQGASLSRVLGVASASSAVGIAAQLVVIP